MSSIYRHADKALQRLFKYTESQFQAAATTARWDELNVIETVEDLYSRIDGTAMREFEQIMKKAYEDAKKEVLTVLPFKAGDFKGIDNVFLLTLMRRYDPKTEYRYDKEWQRKADRLAESILATVSSETFRNIIVNSPEIRKSLQRGLNLMNTQLRNMADTVTDEARNEAFVQAGIDQVMWNTQRDGAVCRVCRSREGKIYYITQVPSKHPRCRCFLSPVLNGSYP